MSVLMILVDFDNVELSLRAAGPLNLARVLVASVPPEVVARNTSLTVRLYGGWRTNTKLTTTAQRIAPVLHANNPSVASIMHNGITINLRLVVELADKPIGAHQPLEETYVKDRSLRKFRMLDRPWLACADTATCGMTSFMGLTDSTACATAGCSVKLGSVLIRDEQKMVDTLMVADIAQQVFVAKARDVVVVSSDTDMWPGILLALRSECNIIHVHTKKGWKTQRHLMNTLAAQMRGFYQQLSI